MKTPKERLKEIYDEYLKDNNWNKDRSFINYIQYVKNKSIADLTLICRFSTTSECRKAINKLENPNKHLEDSLNAIDKTIKENPEKVREIAENVKQNWQSVSDKITQSTKNSGYTVYIPESAKKSEQQETWQDILDEFAKFGKGKLGDWLIENFKTPERK